ncbi:hypothetical protein Taro_018032, partial [Colocasia esculenta]|nr:hypothetical protein [Colocasia esculenta]
MRRDYWESLCNIWAAERWQQTSTTMKVNRASSPKANMHTSGSVSFATHQSRLKKELKRPLKFQEVFDKTHKKKRTDQYISERAQEVAESYSQQMTEKYAGEEEQPQLDPEVWVAASGALKKGHVYGLGKVWTRAGCYMAPRRAIIQQRMRRGLSYLDGSHVGFQGPVDSWKEFPLSVWELLFDMFTRRYAFTRPEDLPRARVVWESTAQTNLRKSMWEAWDKAMKTTGSRDPTAWLDYGPVWMRMDYWESLCHRWATGPWQERSQAAKRNRATHPEKNVHTSGSVSYATHSQKLIERAPTFREL